MLVQCKMSLQTICGFVYMDSGATVQMPISYRVRLSSSIVSSGANARRRLLGVFDAERRRMERRAVLHNATLELKHNSNSSHVYSYDDSGGNDHHSSSVPSTFFSPQIYSYENDYDKLTHDDLETILAWPLWNQTSSPCSQLAFAYQHHKKLGILDEHELRKCAYWRWVGHNTIHEFNLTALHGRDTFLVSLDDLSAAIVQKDVLAQILSDMHILMHILLMHPYMKPVRALVIWAANEFEQILLNLHLENLRKEQLLLLQSGANASKVASNKSASTAEQMLRANSGKVASNKRVSTAEKVLGANSGNVASNKHVSPSEKVLDEAEAVLEDVKRVAAYDKPRSRPNTKRKSNMKPRENTRKAPVLQDSKQRKSSTKLNPKLQKTSKPQKNINTHKRKLLVTMSEIQAVQQYSAAVLQGAQNPPLALVVAQVLTKVFFTFLKFTNADSILLSAVMGARPVCVAAQVHVFNQRLSNRHHQRTGAQGDLHRAHHVLCAHHRPT